MVILSKKETPTLPTETSVPSDLERFLVAIPTSHVCTVEVLTARKAISNIARITRNVLRNILRNLFRNTIYMV